MNDNKNIILGAGLAGLSAAYHGDSVIYEKGDVAGGTCISSKKDGYTVDLGIHVLHTRNAYVLNLLLDELYCKMRTQTRSAWIYSNKAMTKYPFQVNTFGLPATIVNQCIQGFKEAHAGKRLDAEFKNYEDWVYAMFGSGIADHFYLPYSEKFWTIPAREMTTDWLDVRVPVPSLEDVIEGSLKLNRKE